MDFKKKAEETWQKLHGGSESGCDGYCDENFSHIAEALKEAYNEGIERSAETIYDIRLLHQNH